MEVNNKGNELSEEEEEDVTEEEEEENEKVIRDILRNIYYDDNNPNAYGSMKALFEEAKNRGYVISMDEVKEFLKGEEIYTTHKNFKRAKYHVPVVVPHSLYQIDMDSAVLPSKSKKGKKYFILAVDLFTRKISAKETNDLKGASALKAIERIFKDLGVPKYVRTDRGTEYLNKNVKKYFADNDVEHLLANPPNKANYAERAIRTIKSNVYKYMQRKGKPDWDNKILEGVVGRYNDKVHRSTGYAPNAIVNKSVENDVLLRLMRDRFLKSPFPKPYAFDVNDAVRVAYEKLPFSKDYEQKFSTQVYFISSRSKPFNVDMYTLKDHDNEPLAGRFSANELQKVNVDDQTEYRIEKVLSSKNIKGVPHVKVKWLGYGDKFNSWIPKSEVKKLK